MTPAVITEPELIDRKELKEKIDRRDNFKLVMVYTDWAFRMKHIPGSIHIPLAFGADDRLRELKLDDEIVVYCTSQDCAASKLSYRILKARGYTNVRRYAGGIYDWEEAGYPLEGEAVSSQGVVAP